MSQDSGILEVTDMFPFGTNFADEVEQEEYLVEMLKSLRDVNVDHTAVGWYQSVNLDAPLQPAFIEAQAAYQSEIADSCLVVYDHLQSAQGVPSVRAFRLQEDFMRAWRDSQKHAGRVNQGLLADLVEQGIYEELPVKIAVSAMDKLLLSSLAIPEPNVIGSENAHRLSLARLAQNLLLSLDDSIAESSRVQHYVRSIGRQQQLLATQIQKRRAENAQREQNGEAVLPEDDLVLNLKGISDPPRLGLLYSSIQLSGLLDQAEDYFAALKAKQSF